MKRVIRAAELSNRGKDWLASDEVEEMMQGCTSAEKKLIGKIINSPDPGVFIMDTAEVIDTLSVKISSSFDEFIQKALEKI